MTLILQLYRGVMHGLSPLAPILYDRRLSAGKELPGRLNERLARNLPERPSGLLVWMHGASVGESKLLLGLAEALHETRPSLNILFTSQTASSADIVSRDMPRQAVQQMAPLDTPDAARRFVEHWGPDICVFAEGEIWPNLLSDCKAHGCKTVLVNARMTEKSIAGWQRAPRTARKLFSKFDTVLASDRRTAAGLSQMTGRKIESSGNLKVALAGRKRMQDSAPQTPPHRLFPSARQVLLGASTHPGEERLLLQTLTTLPDETCLILAPRHIDRVDEITALAAEMKFEFITRSSGKPISEITRVLIADTLGEMDNWYQSADKVYLGGGHRLGIGGHNPLEPLSYGLPIITGPYTENFSDTYETLTLLDCVQIAGDTETMQEALAQIKPPKASALDAYFTQYQKTLETTLSAMTALLDEKAQ